MKQNILNRTIVFSSRFNSITSLKFVLPKMVKNNLFGLCGSLTVIFFIISACSNVTCVKVSVYYESLCGDSIQFIDSQLYPYWKNISNYVDLELVPYGKAIHNIEEGKYEFFCQHGPAECRGNKYQSCLLSQNRGKDHDVPLIYCIMKSRDPASLTHVTECADRAGYDIGLFKDCIGHVDADELLARNGNKTWQLKPNIAFVPTIVFDDKYDRTEMDRALIDFVAVVCYKIRDVIKPVICKNKELPTVPVWNDNLT